MKKLNWLEKTGFIAAGEPRLPRIGEWYIDKNNERVCYVYNNIALPCSCPNCNHGIRQVVVPIIPK